MEKVLAQPGHIDKEKNKWQIIRMAEAHAKEIEQEKDADLLSTYIDLKRYQIYIDGLLGSLKHRAYEEAEAKGLGDFKFPYDHALVRLQIRRDFDYSGSTKWTGLKARIDQLDQERKKEEEELRNAHKRGVKVNRETGEVTDFQLPLRVKKWIAIEV